MHANRSVWIRPLPAILRADAELKQVSPNLTFIYDPDITLMTCCWKWRKTSVNVANRIANGPVHDKIFTKGRHGIVSCYNSLPLAEWWQHAGTP